ncbi:MAG: hypothetical protein Fur0021_11820 [Candidatus Promineifilaceae bacterium]
MLSKLSQITWKWPQADVRARLSAARWLVAPFVAFAASRLGIFLAAYLGAHLLPDNVSPPLYHLRPPDNVLLDVFGSRWDTGFYLSIATEGYQYWGAPLPSVAFFPLYPLLIRLAMPLMGGDAMLAGIMVSHATLLLAAVLFYRLVSDEWGPEVANRAVWYLLIFPTAFFGSAVYSESLFLLTTIGAFYLARKGYWKGAALLAIATTLTRLVGLIIVPLLLLEWLRQYRQGEQPGWGALLAPALAPLGTGAYMAYLQRTFGDPLAFVHASAAWARTPRSPLVMLAELWQQPAEGWLPAILAGHLHMDNWTDFAFIMAFLAIAFALLVEQRWGEGFFVFLGVLIPLNSGLLMSQRRYVWVLFPAFILLARWGKHAWVDRAITVLFITGLVLFTALFANGYWVG